ncbi:hypothetical protein EIP86_009911 [Pleurotus ostreatoroseus]|nr:hypothetical protein EIP86_009911 [Pleurotus ostreatoroseus]
MGIHKLPEEMLVRIFCALRDMHIALRSLRWIAVTHVCRSWRLVALDAAELWTYIYSMKLDCLQTFIMRSKQAPLDILYHKNSVHQELDYQDLDLLLAHSHRLRDVDILVSEAARRFCFHPFAQGAALIRSLTLSLGNTPLDPNIIPQIYFQELPQLRYLTLIRFPIAIPDAPRGLLNPSLRSLYITAPCPPLLVSKWISLLTELPLLESLSLCMALSFGHAQLEQPSVHLPRLTFMEITDMAPVDEMIALLERIVPAENIRIRFIQYSEPASDPQFGQCLKAVSEKLTNRHYEAACNQPTFLRLGVSGGQTGSNDLEIMLWTPSSGIGGTCNCHEHVPFPILHLKLLLRTSLEEACRRVCDMLCKILSLGSAKTLHLCSLIDFAHQSEPGTAKLPDAFMDLLLQMPNISAFFINAKYLNPGLFEVLGGPATQALTAGSVEGPRFLPLPSLQRLVIEQDFYKDTLNLEAVRRLLLSRQELGLSISHLHIKRGSAIELEKLEDSLIPLTMLGCQVDYCLPQSDNFYLEQEHVYVSMVQ